jgi:hypothetical protein
MGTGILLRSASQIPQNKPVRSDIKALSQEKAAEQNLFWRALLLKELARERFMIML